MASPGNPASAPRPAYQFTGPDDETTVFSGTLYS